MIVSPTEPAKLRALGRVALLPETHGADVLIMARGGRYVGVQRKERSDLISSLGDGRLGEQVAKMQSLHLSILIVEGDLNFTTDGVLMGTAKYGRAMTRKFLDGVFWSIQSSGTWVTFTSSLAETCEVLLHLEEWINKPKHQGLATRGGVEVNARWGKPTNRDFQLHLLTGLPNVGPEVAGKILDHYGGLPWRWRDDVDAGTLQEIDGIGPKKAQQIMGALSNGLDK